MENNKFKFTKIPLESFLEILSSLYEEGYDFIDLEGVPNISSSEEIKDIITIIVSEQYMSNEEEEEEEEKKKIDFDKDYEQLL